MYTVAYIAGIVQGKLIGPRAEDVVEQLLTDSRKLLFPRQSLFFALAGPRRDGNQFIPDLYEKGVRNFVVSGNPDTTSFPEANFIVVNDPLEALQQLAGRHRRRFAYPVIGITGSNGKTIVKEWLNQLLESDYEIVRSPKSYNSQIGVPLSVWQMQESHTLAIFEAGISQAGEMERLEKIIQPDIGIFTNIGEAHNEGFVNSEQKIREKLILFRQAKTIIYCKDYPDIHQNIALLWQRLNQGSGEAPELFNWSAVSEARLQLLTIYRQDSYSTLSALYEGNTLELTIPFADDASIENALHCWCLLLHLGWDQDRIRKAMLRLNPVAMRLELKPGINRCTIINDSYSADLSSFRIALDFQARQAPGLKRTVILSDILQSGKQDRSLYSSIAAYLEQRQVSRLIAIGERIGAHRTLFQNVQGLQSFFYPNTESFLPDLPRIGFREEVILLKGARVFEFERIADLLQEKLHQTVLEINLSALQHNLRQYQQRLRPDTRIMVMVKAFAYGSGAYEVARILQFHKVDYLAVAYTDEGVDLRKAGITLPIMVMNPDEGSFRALVEHDLEPDIYTPQQAQAFARFLRREGIPQYPVHIEFDSGMHRLGFAEEEMPVLKELLSGGIFKVQSVFSHLVASEDPQHDAFTRGQAEKFERLSNQLSDLLPYPFLRHLSNSSGIARHPDLQYDMVRLGIGLYGISGKGEDLDLQEVSTLKSVITQISRLRAGETVGYGRSGVVTGDAVVATVAIGYADGYHRVLGNGNGKMWVNGRLAPVIGSVCMDMTMIDVTGIPDLQAGDSVQIFGPELSVRQLAQWAQTIPYEILTGISQRVKRVYYEE